MTVADGKPDFGPIIRLGYGYRGAKALLSAVELDVFTALSGGALDLRALRTKTGVDERGARDFFDALVALGLLDRDDDGRYRNAPASAHYLDRTSPDYLGYELEFINEQLYAKWNLLTDSLRTGKPQTQAAPADHYASRYRDASALKQFAAAMTAGTAAVARALAAGFRWSDYQSVIDIGCAEGCLPVQLALSHPHMTCGGFDLPPLEPAFKAYVASHGVADRLTFYPGDFLRGDLPPADVLVFGRVLHNWDLAAKRMLLSKAHAALPERGCLIVYERFIDDQRRANATALLSSLNMLVMTPGGFDFTAADCRLWLLEAGFTGIRIEGLTPDQSMIVAMK
jgi:hypothetical protein